MSHRNPFALPLFGITGLCLLVGGALVLQRASSRSVHAQQATINGVPGQTITLDSTSVMNLTNFVQSVANSMGFAQASSVPTRLSQITNDAGFIAFAPFTVTFPATALIAIGNYPASTTGVSASMGQGVECNLINFSSPNYRVTGIVSGSGAVALNLNVTQPLTTNTTAPIARCFAY